VNQGQQLVRGYLIARIDNLEGLREPHLQFQLTTLPDLFASEGLPDVIKQDRMKPAHQDWSTRARKFC
jgi:hypothetical protein